jgi:hypothetical protein
MGDSPHRQASGDDEGQHQRAQLTGPSAASPVQRGSLFMGIGTICDTAARLTEVDGAAVAVLAPSQHVRELVYATDPLAQHLDELQFTLGEGPCLDSYRGNRPLLCARLDDPAVERQWPAFAAELIELGVAAVFVFPVPGRHRPLGVLELYRRTTGALDEVAQQSAEVCAAALRTTLEHNWLEYLAASVTEEAAIELAATRDVPGPSDPFTRAQVHVAAGMIAVQLGVSTHDALDRLRAYAFAQNRSSVAIAADVVTRRLSFGDLDDDESSVDS